MKLLKSEATGLLRLARSLPMGATPLCNELSVVADQDGQTRSLIQTGAQTYRALPLILNPKSTFLAHWDAQKSVAQGLVIMSVTHRQPRFSQRGYPWRNADLGACVIDRTKEQGSKPAKEDRWAAFSTDKQILMSGELKCQRLKRRIMSAIPQLR